MNNNKREEVRKCLNCSLEWKVICNKNLSRTQNFCKDCIKILSIWERKTIILNSNPDKRKQYLEGKRKEFLNSYIKQILHRTKIRALNKGLEFNLLESDIIIPDICPILEIPLIIGTKGNYEYSPSIDRIDNSKGYTKENIQIISKKANSMKNSASTEELLKFCKNILRYSPNCIKEENTESKDKEL